MIDIKEIRKELEIKLQENSRPNIDSIFIEKNGEIEKLEYKVETLHELRSCAKILVAMAIGIAIDRKMQVNGEQISLDTKVYPVIKDKVNIKNDENISKIKNWTIKNLLTHTTGYESQMMSERYIEDIDKKELLDYALNYEMPYEVGARFAYNNAEPFILSVFFQEAFDINLFEMYGFS